MDKIICSVDIVLLCLRQGSLHLALLAREHAPFCGEHALPGGYVRPAQDQDTRAAAARVLRDKTGIVSPYLEELGCFSGRVRDPRGWSLSIAYYALVSSDLIQPEHSPGLLLEPADQCRPLPFDHNRILSAAIERVRNKSSYSSLPVHLCGEQFTLPQLQAVYEALLREPINKVSFRRKMEELDILEPIPGAFETGRANRPAQLYRLKAAYRQQLSITDRGINPG